MGAQMQRGAYSRVCGAATAKRPAASGLCGGRTREPQATEPRRHVIVQRVVEKTGNPMKQTNALVFHIIQELNKDPRPTCLPCLGITAPEHWAGVHTHTASQYRL